MRHRDLAAIAVTATVAATPGLATVMEDLTTAPPAAADTTSAGVVLINQKCKLDAPWLHNFSGEVSTALEPNNFKGAASCELPGTLSLQATQDHSSWKSLGEIHRSVWSMGDPLNGGCQPGTWWYQGYFVADDGSFTGGTDNLGFPTQFTCAGGFSKG